MHGGRPYRLGIIGCSIYVCVSILYVVQAYYLVCIYLIALLSLSYDSLYLYMNVHTYMYKMLNI